jgi:hypothetical protein
VSVLTAEKEAFTVDPKANRLELVVISALFVLLSLGGAVWDVTSGLLMGGIDGIMLMAVCLAIAAIFAGMLVYQLQKMAILPSFASKSKTASATPAAAKPPATAPAKSSPSTTQPTAQVK